MRWLENFWNHFNYPKLQSLMGQFDIYHCLHHLMPPTDGKPRIMMVHDFRRYKIAELWLLHSSIILHFILLLRGPDLE